MTVLEYSFRVVDQNAVDRAFASLERRAGQHNARMDRLFGGTGVGSRASAARTATSRPGPARQQTSQTIRGLAEIGRAARAEELRVGRERIAIERRVERQRLSAIQSAGKAEERERKRVAATELRAQVRGRQEFRRSAFGALRGAGETLAGIGKAGVGVLGIGGGAVAAGAVAEATRLDDITRRLVVGSRGPGKEGAFTADDLRKRITQTAIKSGITPEAVAEGLQQTVARTGDLKMGVDQMETLATVAQATGASFADVSATAADLMQKFDVKKTEDMGEAFAELVFQGKKGAFELKDMAQQFPEMAAAAQRAGMKGIGGLRTLGGLSQIARQSTGSGAEASTAVQMMLTQLGAKGAQIESGEALGGRKAQVFTDKTKSQLRDVPDVLADIIAQSGGNIPQLQSIFDIRGIRAASPMIARFKEASAAAGGGEKGREAGRKAVVDMIAEASKSGASFSDVQRDANDAMKSFATQLTIFNTKIKEAIASEVFPELVKLAPELGKLVPHVRDAAKAFVSMVKFFEANPWSGIGLLVGAALVKEIASAGIAGMVQRIITGGGGAGGVAGATAGAGAIPLLPALAAAGGVALAGDQLTKLKAEVGSTANLTDLLPGFKGGSFSTDQLLAEANPLEAGKKRAQFLTQFGSDVAGFDSNLNAAAKAEALVRQQSGAANQQLQAALAPPKVEGGKELQDAAQQLKNAAVELSRAQPNRTDKPSPVKG